MYPTKITIKNFQSFCDEQYVFSHIPTLIEGLNLTEIDQDSNGSGKSTIQNAIGFALMGQSLDKKDLKSLIRRGEKSCSVELSLYCPVRKQNLIIKRFIDIKGGSKIELYHDDNQPVSVATVIDANRYISNWLDIDFEDIKNYFVISSYNYKSFYNSSDTDKIKTISRFSDFNSVDNANLLIQEDIDKKEKEFSSIKTELDKEIARKEVYEKNLHEEENKDVEKEFIDRKESILNKIAKSEKDILSYKEEIESINKIVPSYKDELIELEEKIEKLNKDIDEKTVDYSELFDEITGTLNSLSQKRKIYEDNVNELNKSKSQIKSILLEIKVKLSGVITCPHCKFQFIPSSEDSVEELKSSFETKDEELKSFETKLLAFTSKIDNVVSSINEVKKERDLTEKDERDNQNLISSIKKSIRDISLSKSKLQSFIDNSSSQKQRLLSQIKEKEREIEFSKNQLSELKPSSIDLKRIKDLKDLINKSDKNIKVYSEQKDNKIDDINDTKAWIIRFKEFKRSLSFRQLKVLEGFVNKYLSDMKSDMRIFIDGYKTLANGQVKEEISINIDKNGLQKFSSFSHGEQGRLEIAMILSLQKMINATNKYGGLTFLSIDEVLEGLDSKGLGNIMQSLSTFTFPILITTHVSNTTYGNTITIVKENGISKIKK